MVVANLCLCSYEMRKYKNCIIIISIDLYVTLQHIGGFISYELPDMYCITIVPEAIEK